MNFVKDLSWGFGVTFALLVILSLFGCADLCDWCYAGHPRVNKTGGSDVEGG
jgi:hypothetical protein